MAERTPDFLLGATNVYRTKNYIVKQRVTVHTDADNTSWLFSRDTYYCRTPRRDREYEAVFAGEGKRIPSSMHIRMYIN